MKTNWPSWWLGSSRKLRISSSFNRSCAACQVKGSLADSRRFELRGSFSRERIPCLHLEIFLIRLVDKSCLNDSLIHRPLPTQLEWLRWISRRQTRVESHVRIDRKQSISFGFLRYLNAADPSPRQTPELDGEPTCSAIRIPSSKSSLQP